MKTTIAEPSVSPAPPAATALLARYIRTADRAYVLEANNRPRAARRLRMRAGGMRAALRRMGVDA